MKSVNIAELKNQLSAYLRQVRAGEEIVVRDRNLPIAKLVPLAPSDTSAAELALAASGKLALPAEELDEAAFWALESVEPAGKELAEASRRAVTRDREERDARILGR